MGLFDKKYMTSEEFSLDACYPKNYKKCLKFIIDTLRGGAPYPGDFTHEKLVVQQFRLLTCIDNSKAMAVKYATLLDNSVMPYVIRSLSVKNRKGDYLYTLPTAYIEDIYKNLCAIGKGVDKEKATVAFVIAFLWIREKTFETVYDLPEGEWGYAYFADALKYHDAEAVSKLAPKIQDTLKKVESLKARRK